MATTNHWDRARALVEKERRARLQALSEEEGIRSFCSLLAFSYEQRGQAGWDQMMERRWQDKLARRIKLVEKMAAQRSDQQE